MPRLPEVFGTHGRLEVLEQAAHDDGGVDGLLDSLPFGRIEIEDEPVRLVERRRRARPTCESSAPTSAPASAASRGCRRRDACTVLRAVVRVGVSIGGQPRRRARADVLMKPRRLVDALVPVLERERPVAQRAHHRLGHGLVVVGDVLLGDAVARIEDAIGIA